jgi:hypothetical protein
MTTKGKWLLIVGGVLAGAALLVAAQSLTSAPRPGGSVGPTPGLSLDSSSSAAVTRVASDGPAAGAATSTPPTVAVTASPRRVQRPVRDPIDASAPLTAGAPIAPLATMPAVIVSGLASGAVPSGSSYGVVLHPWGTGPISPAGPTLVVTIESMKALDGAPGVPAMRGRVMLVVEGGALGESVPGGGRFSARITFVPQSGRLVPLLSKVVSAAD